MKKNRIFPPKSADRIFGWVTWLLLTFTAADAAYIFGIVVEMTRNPALCQVGYHAVPAMVEHILAAVVLYLGGMVLMSREGKRQGLDG